MAWLPRYEPLLHIPAVLRALYGADCLGPGPDDWSDSLGQHLPPAAGGGEQIVQHVARHPGHARHRDHEAQRLSPSRVLVVTHRDGGVLHKVEHEDELEIVYQNPVESVAEGWYHSPA